MKKNNTTSKPSGRNGPDRQSEQSAGPARLEEEERNKGYNDEEKERVIDVNHISNRARKSFHNDGPGGSYEGF